MVSNLQSGGAAIEVEFRGILGELFKVHSCRDATDSRCSFPRSLIPETAAHVVEYANGCFSIFT